MTILLLKNDGSTRTFSTQELASILVSLEASNAASQTTSGITFVRIGTGRLLIMDDNVLPTSLHMTNTVFIDRAIIVQPFTNGDIPDELSGLEFANSSMPRGDSQLPSHVQNITEGDQLITVDEEITNQGRLNFQIKEVDQF